MSTLLIPLPLLVGQGKHAHWTAAYQRREPTTQSMLCTERAKALRESATPGPKQRLRIWCRPELPRA